MNYQKLFNKVNLLLLGGILCLATVGASAKETMSPQVKEGMNYFQGATRFKNGGPACISCHNVNNESIIPGGLYAKDLTDAFGRLGAGVRSFVESPPFPAMAASYKNNPVETAELDKVVAFLEYANKVKDSQKVNSGYSYFIIGGAVGLLVMIFAIQLMWGNRKRKMVKEEIFSRQSKSWDAKF